MGVIRAAARPMLASIFVMQGMDTFQNPERVAETADPVVKPIAKQVPAVPADPEQAVRLNGAVQVVAGTTLGLGILPRLSALTLAGTLVPTTLAGHRFWEYEDPQQRAQQRIHFLKNLTMLGGLLIAAADTDGSPSLAWRRRKTARAANRHLTDISAVLSSAVDAARDGIAATGEQLPGAARDAADAVRDAARKATTQATAYAHHVAGQGPGAVRSLAKGGKDLKR